MNRQIMVKKLWTMNPRGYEEITLQEASTRYTDYLMSCSMSAKTISNIRFKSFIDWLETEI